MSFLLRDPWFVAMIDGVLAKHADHFTARQLRIFREQMARTFTTHPGARAVLAKARPDLVTRLRGQEPTWFRDGSG